MVHILSDVLLKVHRALKPGGLLYSSQPGDTPTHLAVHADGEVGYEVDLAESYFGYFLELCRRVLWAAVESGLFVVEAEATWPSTNEFISAAAWRIDRLNDTDDDEEINRVATLIEQRHPDGVDVLEQHRQNWCLLLRKV